MMKPLTTIRRLLLTTGVLLPVVLFAQRPVNIIPQPVSLSVQEGYFTIDKQTTIRYAASHSELKAAADFLSARIEEVSGLRLAFNVRHAKSIELSIVPEQELGKEGYRLQVTPATITIRAPKREGIVYGIQSLLQTLPTIRTNALLQVPLMQVKDYPRFSWRGMHLDVSRHFFSPEFIKQ